ncbi:hypothetical protein HPB47_013696, partial [Ixodes persulcatus]
KLAGKSKRRTAAQTVARRQNKSDIEFTQEVANFFFPQSPSPDTTCYSPEVSVDGAHTSDAPFTLVELQDALDHSNMRSTPGPDGVAHADLRNLPTDHKLKILEWMNETGLRSSLSIQGNVLMLHHDVLADPSSIQLKTIAAVDVQKAFDSVSHSSAIESAKLMGNHGRALSFTRKFLKDRRFQVKIGSSVGPETINHAFPSTPDLYDHGNLNKLEDVFEQLTSAQLTRLLGTKAGQAILQEIGRLPSSAPKPPPLPPPPWEMHVTLTADAPLPRRMDADHPERRAYHAKAHERHVSALDPRRHVVCCTDAASGLVPAKGAPPTSSAWVNIAYPDAQKNDTPMPTGVSRKAQTLVCRTATNTLMLPALRNRIFQDDPQQGYCTACNTLATTQHVIWEYSEHAAARLEALADTPVADQSDTFEVWVIPQDKPPPTVRLLWNQLCSFFYADG